MLTKTAHDRLHAYIVVSLLTGARTEELRALRWDHVHLDDRLGPPHLEVWRSVRATGDTKTRKSRRTLALSGLCVEALRSQRIQQAQDRLAAGERWTETGLVFTTAAGTGMNGANVRRDFRRALALVPGLDPAEWTPREPGTLSSRCCRMLACRLRRSLALSGTAAAPSPSLSTATRSGP